MSVASDTTPAAQPPASSGRRPEAGAGFGLAKRLLLVKEGPIVIVTLITIIYFI